MTRSSSRSEAGFPACGGQAARLGAKRLFSLRAAGAWRRSRTPRGFEPHAVILFLVMVWSSACAPAAPAVVPEGAPRRPDGVAIDLPTAPPRTVAEAHASDGIVALETPLSTEAARSVVMRFFGAMVTEDRVTFQSLFAARAKSYNPSTSVEDDALSFWNRRFDALEYQQLAGGPMLREDGIELFRIDQWQRGSVGDDTQPTDVIAYFRCPATTTGRPLTGESISLQLRRFGDHYQIIRITEDFTFP
jgi:hypothetical protein